MSATVGPTVNLIDLANAVENLDETLSTSKLLTDPTGIGQALNRSEAVAFADLLRAVGLDHHAADLLGQHQDSEYVDEDADTDPEDVAEPLGAWAIVAADGTVIRTEPSWITSTIAHEVWAKAGPHDDGFHLAFIPSAAA